MPDTDWMAQLSGPVARRASLLASLDRAGVDVDHAHEPRGFDTDPTEGWVVARHHDVDELAARAAEHDYRLRAHWPTPTCIACGGHSARNGVACLNCGSTGRTEKRPPTQADVIAELQARIARIEAKGN